MNPPESSRRASLRWTCWSPCSRQRLRRATIDHILLYGLESSTVQSTARTFDENVVPVGEGELVPLSDHYGLRSVIRVP